MDTEVSAEEEKVKVAEQMTELEAAKRIVEVNLPYGNGDKELVSDLADLYCEANSAMKVFPEAGFETQEGDEKVILVMRKAFVTNWKWILVGLLMAVAPVGLGMLDVWPDINAKYWVFIILFWELLVLGYYFESFLHWYYNIYILTDRRVVDIDFHHMLAKEMSDADLDKIQDVTFRSAGAMAAFFHYGDIFVQTAAQKAMFEFHAVNRPEKVTSVIRLLAQNYSKK